MPTDLPGNGVYLRDVADDDLPIFFDHQRDPAANQMAAFPARDREAFMAHWAKIAGDPTCIAKTIVVNGHVAGNVCSWNEPEGRAVGYWVGQEFWGRGVATQALSELLRLVETRPLHAHVAKHNRASFRVLEKCGFRISGETNAPDDELILRLDERAEA